VTTTPDPIYVDEQRVSALTGMSRPWLQRARGEGIGPRHFKIGRRVVYKLGDVTHWIESGASAKEHLSSKPAKKAGAK
jgi:predicted DNA-binding transcriptional regulator AlpA